MLLKLRLGLYLCLVLVFGCKTISVQQETLYQTDTKVVLGSVGTENNQIIKSNYSSKGFPKYKQGLRLTVSLIPFNNKTYKAYKEAAISQVQGVTIKYVDSLPNKPSFVSLQIGDHLALLKELNSKHNTDVKNYFADQTDSKLVTNISMVLSPQLQTDLLNADNVFLIQDGLKSYAVQLFKNNKEQKRIPLSEGLVFGYKTSNCCWKETERKELQIIGLVDRSKRCPKGSYKSAKLAKKDINYFKF